MNTAPLLPAKTDGDGDGSVFLAGNALPARWQGRQRFVILETGFGLGTRFLGTWAAWRADPGRCAVLHYIAIESSPPRRDQLGALRRDPALAPLAALLGASWPPLTWNLHRLTFESGAVQLLLAFGDVEAWLAQIGASVDAFFVGGVPAEEAAPWGPRRFKAMARRAAPDATVAVGSALPAVRDGLVAAGFDVRTATGESGTGDGLVGRFAPRFTPRPPPRSRPSPAVLASREPVVIVGAGLAGCATAWALAEQGRRSVLVERRAGLAAEASGNAAGLFHGVVHGDDGRHARFHRAAALMAHGVVTAAIAQGVRGRADGLLRLASDGTSRDDLQRTVDRLGLPAGYVQAVDAARASALAGTPLSSPAWYFPQGGWVDPSGLCRWFVAQAGEHVALRCSTEVAALVGDGDGWRLAEADGETLVRATAVVLANGMGAVELLGSPAWPVAAVRGQVSAMAVSAAMPPAVPRIPIAGAGYVLPPIDGVVWFGASTQRGDADPAVRRSDGEGNLARLSVLMGRGVASDAGLLTGRTGFRAVSDDRLPIVGAVPALHGGGRLDAPRRVARAAGLFVITALGSRGIATSALGGRVVAAAVSGAPMPLEADLLDAIDPARFAAREGRRSQATAAGDGPPPRR